MNYCYFSFAVEESVKIQNNLTKSLFEDHDVTSAPARNSNDTVHAKLAMNLLKIIELVWMQRLFLKPMSRQKLSNTITSKAKVHLSKHGDLWRVQFSFI